MNKDKQIEEMTRDLENHTCMSQFQAEIASRMLYDTGYRKASEVAEEMLNKVNSIVNDWRKNYCSSAVAFAEIIMVIKKYTEEGK